MGELFKVFDNEINTMGIKGIGAEVEDLELGEFERGGVIIGDHVGGEDCFGENGVHAGTEQ